MRAMSRLVKQFGVIIIYGELGRPTVSGAILNECRLKLKLGIRPSPPAELYLPIYPPPSLPPSPPPPHSLSPKHTAVTRLSSGKLKHRSRLISESHLYTPMFLTDGRTNIAIGGGPRSMSPCHGKRRNEKRKSKKGKGKEKKGRKKKKKNVTWVNLGTCRAETPTPVHSTCTP